MSPRRLAAVPDAPRRGWGLIRVSKARGREDLISPELQRTAIEDHARHAGIEITAWREVLDESASRDRSGWWATLEEAVSQVEAGGLDVVVVWKYSRAARHRRRWAIALDRIEVAGGSLESATEGLDTTTSTGRLARGMLAELAAWEAERIGETWKETHARRRQQGLPHSGAARFGYRYDRHAGYTIDPDTGPILADLYRRYLAGEGHTTLARWLNRQGIPTVRQARTGWSVQAVIRLLDSGFGAGLLHEKSSNTWHPAAHSGVITAEEWQAYQQARQVRWGLPARVREPAYPLTGLVRCGLCGKAMVAASDKRHGPGYLYRCTTRISSGTCPGAWVTRAQLEQRVLAWLAGIVADVDAKAATKSARRAAADVIRVDVKATERELLRLDSALERARDYLIDGTLTRAEYDEQRNRLGVRRVELDKRLGEMRRDLGRLAGPALRMIRGLLADWETLPVRDRRDMLATLVRRIEVRPGVRGAQDVQIHPLWETDST